MKRRKVLLLICFAVICLSSLPASADLYGTLSVDWNGLIRGSNKLSIFSPAGYGSYYEENYVGLHSLSLGALDTTSPPADTTLPGNSNLTTGLVEGFCIDLWDGFPTGMTTYEAVSLNVAPDATSGGPMLDTKAKYIAQLLNTNTYATAFDAAVVQTAIWEIIYEPLTGPANWSLTSGQGSFYLNTAADAYGEAAIATAANTMLSWLTQASSYSQYTAIRQDLGKQAQDFVLVPTPTAVLLGILGLGAVGIKLRKYT